MYDYTQDNLSIATSCQTCLALDTKCEECLEVSEARVCDLAHELVDEGSIQYPRQWLINRPQPSGHDWTDRDGEFLPPIVLITDGGEVDNLWELDDETQRARETECQWCHILTPKMYNQCQTCDQTLEHNVR
jgi:hypothetical protein